MKEIILTSSILICAVLLLRWLFRAKVSRRLIYASWLLVALRLLIPVQLFQFRFSVLNQVEPVTGIVENVAKEPVSGASREEIYQDVLEDYVSSGQQIFIPEVQEQIDAALPDISFDEIYNALPEKGESIILPEIKEEIEVKVQQSITVPTLGQIARTIWLLGMGAMLIWFAGVNILFNRKLRKASESIEIVNSPVPVKISPLLSSPCLFGFWKPTVYLTHNCREDGQIRRHVLTHELTHLKHRDHIWSLVRCICLCVYWFNPLVWVAAFVSKRDCELACDEAVLQQLGESERLTYGKTLVDMVATNPTAANLLETATAMHETKKALKERVNHIVKKRKHLLISALCLILVLSIVAGCSFTGKEDSTPTTDPSDPAGTTEPGGTTDPPEASVPLETTVPPETTEPPVTAAPQPTIVSCLTSVIYQNNEGDELIQEKYFYDENGNCILKQLFSEYGTPCEHFIYTYNDRNQLTESTECLPNGNTSEKIYYIYDDNGRLIQKTIEHIFDYHTVKQTEYTYDETDNTCTEIQYNAKGTRSDVIKYDSNGNEIEHYNYHHNGDGTLYSTITSTYDAHGNIIEYLHVSAYDSVLSQYRATSEFDSTGKILTYQKYRSGVPREKAIFYFDDAGRVVREDHYSHTGEYNDSFTYTYDEYGNLIEQAYYDTSGDEPRHTTTYTYIMVEKE